MRRPVGTNQHSRDITDNNDFAPKSVWMRSCQGMGVEKVRKDDTARTFVKKNKNSLCQHYM